MELKERSQIAKEDTWDLESIYETDEIWEEDFAAIKKDAEAFVEQKGKITADIACMAEVLDSYYGIQRRLSKLMVYASMRADQDTGNSWYQKLSSRAHSLGVLFGANSSWLQPEILSLGEEALLSQIEKDDSVKTYARIICEMLRTNAHTLSPEMEEVLAQAEEMAASPRKIFQVFNNADMKYPDAVLADGRRVSITNSNLVTHLESEDRELRKAVFETYYAQLKSFGNTIAGIQEANVKQAAFYAAQRKYSSSRAYYLDGANIPERVYDNLIEAVHEAFPAMYRYVAIRKRLLGVEELHMYDVYTPLMEAGNRKYPIDEAKKIVKEGLKPMGEEYLALLQKGFDERWIDVYPNKGKRTGAYSWGCYDSKPFVCLNHQETLDNVFTLAHEMGHSIHSYYSRHNQPYHQSGYRIFVAEVASTCNEALLIHDLLKKTEDKKERAYLLNHYLDTFKGTMFRQTMFAEFEREMHKLNAEGKPLTADVLCDLYHELNKAYFGPDMVSDEEIACEWMRIPHFYTPFYVYQYATGFSAAIALSRKILFGTEADIEAYKNFLKGGSSMDPIDLLKTAGVDMTSVQPVQDALKVFAELVDELDELTK